MNSTNNITLVYLDHQILDSFLKERQLGLKRLLGGTNVQVVYSNENLHEISKSSGFEQQFLSLLNELNAKHFHVILDSQFRNTGKAILDERESSDIYSAFLENKKESPSGDFGLSEMLGKFYGGQQNKTYREIFQTGSEDLTKLLDELKSSLRNESIPNAINKEALQQAISNIQLLLPEMYSSFGDELTAALGDTPIKNIETALELGPKELQTIKGPRVLQQIWELISKKLSDDSITIEKFFGIVSLNENDDRERTTLEKVNAIYHQLNVVGYYRDSKMHKERRFRASVSDMTHAGLATFCDVFICLDEDLSRKAKAAYEYLNRGPLLVPEFG